MLLYEAFDSTGRSSYQSVHTPLSKGMTVREMSSSFRDENTCQFSALSLASAASVAGTGNGEKILQSHMGAPGMRLLRLLDSTTEKAMSSKEAKELRKTLLRFTIKADLLYQVRPW